MRPTWHQMHQAKQTAGRKVADGSLFVPGIGVFLSLVGLVVQLVWYVLGGRGLLRLGRLWAT